LRSAAESLWTTVIICQCRGTVFLHFMMMTHTHLFSVLSCSKNFLGVSPVQHQFCLVYPHSLFPVCSLTDWNGSHCLKPIHLWSVFLCGTHTSRTFLW
jgi:hypothetical protein